jgi:hypothetical protein
MAGGEACIRIRMQNAGLGNPPVQDWGEASPSHLGALAATDEDAPPQPANTTTKDAQLSRVTRNGMVLVVAQHNLSKPGTDLGRTMMLPALKLSLNGFELRDHSLLRRCVPASAASAGLSVRPLGPSPIGSVVWFGRSSMRGFDLSTASNLIPRPRTNAPGRWREHFASSGTKWQSHP